MVASTQPPRFTHATAGTPEADWRRSLDGVPAWQHRFTPRDNVVVVAAHPDDETLGAGGLLASAVNAGARASVLLLTNGDRAYGEVSPALARTRLAEFGEAMRRLGVRDWLTAEIPDGTVNQNLPVAERPLAAILREATLCAGPYEHDGHPDHDAAGHLSREACERAGVPYLGYPIWFWHWAAPADSRNTARRFARFGLAPNIRAQKRQAMSAYRSQMHGLEPILGPGTRAYFERPYEVFVR